MAIDHKLFVIVKSEYLTIDKENLCLVGSRVENDRPNGASSGFYPVAFKQPKGFLDVEPSSSERIELGAIIIYRSPHSLSLPFLGSQLDTGSIPNGAELLAAHAQECTSSVNVAVAACRAKCVT